MAPNAAGIHLQSPGGFAQDQAPVETLRRVDRNGPEAAGAQGKTPRKTPSPFSVGVGVNTQARHAQMIQPSSQSSTIYL